MTFIDYNKPGVNGQSMGNIKSNFIPDDGYWQKRQQEIAQEKIQRQNEEIQRQKDALDSFDKRREEVASGNIVVQGWDALKSLVGAGETLPDIAGGAEEYKKIQEQIKAENEQKKATTLIPKFIEEKNKEFTDYENSLISSGMSPIEARIKTGLQVETGAIKGAGKVASETLKFAAGLTSQSGFSSIRRLAKTVGGKEVEQFLDRNTPEYFKQVDAKLDENGLLNYSPKYSNEIQKTGGTVAEIGSYFIPYGGTKITNAIKGLPFISKVLGTESKLVKIGGKFFYEASKDAIDSTVISAIKGQTADEIKDNFYYGLGAQGAMSIIGAPVSHILSKGKAKKVINALSDSFGELTDEEKSLIESSVKSGKPVDDAINKIQSDRLLLENSPEKPDNVPTSEAVSTKMEISDTERIINDISSTNDQPTISKKLEGLVPESDIPLVSKALENIDDPNDVRKILDSYNPEKIKDDLSLKLATTDNEKKITSLLKGMVPEKDLPVISRIFKGIEDETVIRKKLDELEVDVMKTKETADVPSKTEKPAEATTATTVEATKAETPQTSSLIEDTKRHSTSEEFVKAQKEANDYANSLMKKYGGRFGDMTSEESATLSRLNDAADKLAPKKAPKTPSLPGKNTGTSEDIITGTEYFHATTPDRLNSIIKDGLSISQKARGVNGGGQVFVADTPRHALGFMNDLKLEGAIPKGSNPILLRVRDLPHEKLTQDVIGRHNSLSSGTAWSYSDNIPAKYLEIKKDGKWIPLTDIRKQAQKAPTKAETPQIPKKSSPKSEQVKPTQKHIVTSERVTKSGLSETTLRESVASGLKMEAQDIPSLGTMDMEDQSRRATKIFFNNEEQAWNIARGIEASPDEKLLPGSMVSFLKKKAMLENDVETAIRITNDPGMQSLARRAGQEVKALDTGLTNDPLKAMKEFSDVKKEIAIKQGVDVDKATRDAEKEISSYIDRVSSTDKDFSNVVTNVLRC
jgi:hypothetical protein